MCQGGHRIMALIKGIEIAILVTLVTFSQVDGQFDSFLTPTERQLRANLTELVQFVIHPSAKPSMDLINYALVSGGLPKTQTERMAYLRLMKEIARNTPEFVKQFTKTQTLAGGIKTQTVDEAGMDARVTMQAMQYEQRPAKPAAPTTTVSTPVITPSTFSTFPHETPIVHDTQSNLNQVQLDLTPQMAGSNQVAAQDLQQNKLTPAADGTVSLADVFLFINNFNAQNQNAF